MNGEPEGSLGLVNESRWMKADMFLKVLEHMVKFTDCTQDRQIVMGHRRRVYVRLVLLY